MMAIVASCPSNFLMCIKWKRSSFQDEINKDFTFSFVLRENEEMELSEDFSSRYDFQQKTILEAHNST
ncbi:hypothetical protein CEXT_40841 [Caerostris extrusa]|uniref:Uncharacterized protein n=1 Tax=Caerostris extrusa TaxID=172846 RepID=A0AAV4Y6X5_CAEEX|nr:hypothetical protein CEXT_40841 [Caerostris extrusa]